MPQAHGAAGRDGQDHVDFREAALQQRKEAESATEQAHSQEKRTDVRTRRSYPVFQADQQVAPNFRQFDWVLEEEPPSPEVIERVFNVPEGQAHYAERWGGGHYRATPVMFPVLYTTVCVNLAYVRFHNKTPRRWRASSFPIFVFAWCWHNIAHFIAREKHFLMDWWRNQSFAMDELKRLRDESWSTR